jgi:hypothetical protein
MTTKKYMNPTIQVILVGLLVLIATIAVIIIFGNPRLVPI